MTDKPSRNEEEYFAQREAELLKARKETAQKERTSEERQSHYMKCPKCGSDLAIEDHSGLEVDRCHECKGVWFDAREAETLFKDHHGVADLFKSILRGVSSS